MFPPGLYHQGTRALRVPLNIVWMTSAPPLCTRLQDLLRHTHELFRRNWNKRNIDIYTMYAHTAYGGCARRASGNQRWAVQPKRHETTRSRDKVKAALASDNAELENSGLHLTRKSIFCKHWHKWYYFADLSREGKRHSTTARAEQIPKYGQIITESRLLRAPSSCHLTFPSCC